MVGPAVNGSSARSQRTSSQPSPSSPYNHRALWPSRPAYASAATTFSARSVRLYSLSGRDWELNQSLQWETQRTWFRSAQATVGPRTKVSGVWPSNDAGTGRVVISPELGKLPFQIPAFENSTWSRNSRRIAQSGVRRTGVILGTCGTVLISSISRIRSSPSSGAPRTADRDRY